MSLFGALFLTSACTTTETNPATVSWGDLIYGERLDSHLQQRLKVLEDLKQKVASLENRLLNSEGELDKLNLKLIGLKNNSIQLNHLRNQLLSDIQNKKKELATMTTRMKELKQKEGDLRESFSRLHDQRTVNEQLASYKIEISQLEGDISNLERSIERTILLRAKHALESQ